MNDRDILGCRHHDQHPSSDWFGQVMLAPVLARFASLQLGVVVETLTDPRIYSLARREADLVIRIAGFDEPEVIARRLITVPYTLYGKQGLPRPETGDGQDCPLVVMDTAFGGMPDVAWLKATLPNARIAARSNSRDMQARLCALGVGFAVLPVPLGETMAELVPVDLSTQPPSRENWLGYHRDLKRLPRLRAFVDVLAETLSGREPKG